MNSCNHSLKKKILKKMTKAKGIFFHITGIICIIWFLIRVIPKPDRVRYPCQQMSLTIAIGYIAFWSVLWGSLFFGLGLWVKRVKYKTAAYFPLLIVFFVLLFSISTNIYAVSFVEEKNIDETWEPISNQPMGIPAGLNPGRVVWVWDSDATEEELNGFWWKEENNNQEVIDEMISSGIKNLAGVDNEKEAWDLLFKYFNEKNGNGYNSYRKGEKIAIKVNLNNCWQTLSYLRVDNERDASPYVVKGLLRKLVNIVGVDQKDITVYDASRKMGNWFYNRVFYEYYPSINLVKEFPEVHFVDMSGLANGREKAESSDTRIYFAEGECEYRTLPTCVVEADYLINMPILKRHPIQNGVTLSGKNFFGSWMEPVMPIHGYHKSGLVMGNAAPQVDLLAHKDLGGKTLLFLGDGIFATKIDHSTIAKFEMYPFNNDWTNSLFFSQDPVAMDSVMYDFLHTEGTDPIEGSQNYLHQAAEPISNKYDPENDGLFLNTSLGVHEHWNKTVDIFSSNRYNSIDFVAVYDSEKSVEISKPKSNYLYVFDRVLFRIGNTIVFGDITVETEIKSGPSNVEKIEFYIDGELEKTLQSSPYKWTWQEPSGGKYNLRLDVYFEDDDILTESMEIWKFV